MKTGIIVHVSINCASNANELYNAKLVDRDSTIAAENELKEEKKKLDGYTIFRDSVNAGIDYFSITTGGSEYRYLYDDYLINLNTFETAVSDAEIRQNLLVGEHPQSPWTSPSEPGFSYKNTMDIQ